MMVKLSPVFLLLLGACATSGLGSGAEYDQGQGDARLIDGSPEVVGMLAFLNHPSTTYSLLDHEVGLDRRAAESLIAHRNGPDGQLGWLHDDLFDTIGEVDDRYYVGGDALQKISVWATEHGWVPLEGDDLLGTWDGVVFTVDEAQATVAFANTTSSRFLDEDLGLDARAVANIVAARPLLSVHHLAELDYVGGSALRTLKDNAAGEEGCDQPGWAFDYIYAEDGWQNQVDPNLVAVIDATLAEEAWCGEDSSGQPEFVKVTVDRFNCEAKGYVIELAQPMAALPSLEWYIEFEVNETFEWFLSTCEV